MASIMITHSRADLDALPTEEDRAKARGFADRCAITVLAGLPPRELARVSEITPLTGPEQELGVGLPVRQNRCDQGSRGLCGRQRADYPVRSGSAALQADRPPPAAGASEAG